MEKITPDAPTGNPFKRVGLPPYADDQMVYRMQTPGGISKSSWQLPGDRVGVYKPVRILPGAEGQHAES